MSADRKPEIETTGHSWDGIEELNTPLPRWWLWTFYGTIVWGIVYTILFPAWPLVHGATAGFLGFSTRGQVAEDIAAVETQNAPMMTALASADLTTLSSNPDLMSFATNAGKAIFANNCSQCHGAGAAGVQASGYPNLLDDDWLWGGSIGDIVFTVTNGVRNEQSPDARYSQMPAFGELLSKEEIGAVVAYVRQISGQDYDAALAGQGATIFADNCAACHGDQGRGDRSVGAPNLTDAIWLYGGGIDTLTETVTNARFGVMPAWLDAYHGSGGLTRAEIDAVATYVHGLGGGE